MLNFKPYVMVIMAFASTTVFSGTMGPACTPGIASVPCEKSAWNFGAEALYLQASLGTYIFPDYTTIANNVQEFQNVGNLWGWGFMIDGSYHFNTGNDLNVNWYHLKSSTTLNQNGEYSSVGSSDLFTGALSYSPKTTWDAVNMEFGQKVDYTRALRIRYHGGFEFAHIDYQRNSQYFRVTTPTTSMRTISYNGFGPRAGFDGSYAFENGLSLNVGTAIGAYAGTTHFHYISTGVFANGQILGGRNGSLMRVVPEIEARAGACYTKSFVYGDLSLDAGWMWVNYFNPIMQADDDKLHSSDFSVQGPYVGLKWLA